MARTRSRRALAAAAAGAAAVVSIAAPASATTQSVRPDHGCSIYSNEPYVTPNSGGHALTAAGGFSCSDYHFNFGGYEELQGFANGNWLFWSQGGSFSHTYSSKTGIGSGPVSGSFFQDQICPAHVYGTPSLWRTVLHAHDGQGNKWTLASEAYSCK